VVISILASWRRYSLFNITLSRRATVKPPLPLWCDTRVNIEDAFIMGLISRSSPTGRLDSTLLHSIIAPVLAVRSSTRLMSWGSSARMR